MGRPRKSPRGHRSSRTPARTEPRLIRMVLVALGAALGLALCIQGCATANFRPTKDRYQAPKPVQMSVTGYCNCSQCCSWHYNWHGRRTYSSGPNKGRRKEIGITASGTRTRTGTVAADTRRYPMGTILYVPGYGYGRVEDTGGAIKGDTLDLWFPSHARARQWGRQTLTVHVWLPKPK